MSLSRAAAFVAARVAAGEWADLDELDAANRTVPATFIRQLLLGHPLTQSELDDVRRQQPECAQFLTSDDRGPVPVRLAGVRVRNAVISGALDLTGCYGADGVGLPGLALEHCTLAGDTDAPAPLDDPDHLLSLDLSRSRIARLSLRGSQCGLIRARESVIDGSVDISGVGPVGGWSDQPWPGVDMSTFRAAPDKESPIAEPQHEPVPEHPCCWADFTASRIGGEVAAVDAKLRTPRAREAESYHPMDTRYGLGLARATIGGSLIAYGETVFDGGLLLHLVELGGEVWLGGAKLIKREGSSLDAQGAELGGLFATGKPLQAFGGIYMNSATIHGDLHLRGAELDGDGASALHAESMVVDGDLLLQSASDAVLTARGPVRLHGSTVGGFMDVAGAYIDGKSAQPEAENGDSNDAFNASFMRIGGDARLAGLETRGSAWLKSSDIGGELNLSGANLDGDGADALDGSFMRVAGDANLVDLRTAGCVWLRSANIGDLLNLNGANLRGAVPPDHLQGHNKSCEAFAISGTDITVGDSIWIGYGFKAHGGVRFIRARIEKDFGLVKASVTGLAEDQYAVDLGWTTLAGSLILKHNEIQGPIRLTHANAGILEDALHGYGDCDTALELDGFRYESLGESDLTQDSEQVGCTASRIAWLERVPENPYRAQPYTQLARVLTAQGRVADAREILIAKLDKDREERRNKISSSPGPAIMQRVFSFSSWLFSWLFGYGLDPTKAMRTIIGAVLIGSLIVALANYRGAMIVDQQPIAGSVLGGNQIGAAAATDVVYGNVPCKDTIHSMLYALDVFIPLVDMREESKCEVGAALGAESRLLAYELQAYRLFKAFYALAGWLIISLAILTFSGVLQRRSE